MLVFPMRKDEICILQAHLYFPLFGDLVVKYLIT